MKEKEIYFAGGCFWGTEHFLKQIHGVISTEVGYANSKIANPSYEEVCSGNTDAVETVKVIYNPEEVSLNFLIKLFFMTIDPTTINRQGNDIGRQYRTGIYYTDPADKAVIEKDLAEKAKDYSKPLRVEVLALKNFYKAEAYHQDYLGKNPNGYCHISKELFEYAKQASEKKNTNNISEKIQFRKHSREELKKILTPLEFEVTQNNATERPYENAYWKEQGKGIYVDITTGEPLFSSKDKFISECGWPAFSKPINKKLIVEKLDKSHSMIRQEVRSKLGDAHLGHVFNDGPLDKGGLRYCINSASLRFIPLKDMEKEGYKDYIKYVE